MNIRSYKNSDYGEIWKWWIEQNEIPPLPDMMPEESSFVFEFDGVPILAVALYLTNTKEVCYIENLVGNPKFKSPARKNALAMLIDHLEKFAKEKGFKRLIMLSYRDGLKKRYQELGYSKSLDNLSSFVKEI